MADIKLRLAENVPGIFYITNECIDCDQCREYAPTVFKRNEAIGMSVAFHQPETDDEREHAEQAMTGCPTEAIGNDGV